LAGGAQEVGGDKLGQLTPTDQRDITHHMTSYSAPKAGGRRMKGMGVRTYGVCLPQ